MIRGQRPHRCIPQLSPQRYPSVSCVGSDQHLTSGGADVDDAYLGRMESQGRDLLPFQTLSHKLPVVTGVHRPVDPTLGQRKKDPAINRADEQLSDGLIAQAGVAGSPGVTPVVRSKNTLSKSAQEKDLRKSGVYCQGLGLNTRGYTPSSGPGLSAIEAQVDTVAAQDIESPLVAGNERQCVKCQQVGW